MCGSKRELSNEYLLAKVGFDTAENEPCQVCPIEPSKPLAYRQARLLEQQRRAPRGVAPEVVGDAVHGRDERRAPREGGASVSPRDTALRLGAV